jgi:hypothetical protein
VKRRGLAVAIALAVAVGLSACVSTDPIPVPSKQDLVGTWSHEGASSLALNKDGSFTLSDIPRGVIAQEPVKAGEAPDGPNLSLSGTWKRASGGNDAGGAPGVQLEFGNPVGPNDALTLLVSGAGTGRLLYVVLGYPDSGVEYSYTKR